MTDASPIFRVRFPMPKLVLAFGLTDDTLRIVGDAVGQENVKPYQALSHLEAHLLCLTDVCLVIHIPSEAQAVLCDEIVALRTRFQHVPMCAIFMPSISSCRTILRLGAAGVSQIVTGEPMIRAADLHSALSTSHGEGVAIRLWRHCQLSLPEPLIPVLKAALRIAHNPISADALGDATRMHERTLRKYCVQHALPSPQWIIGWARLLVAGFYLDERGRTLAQVAALLEFPSACALRNQLKRYSASASRSLRASGTSLAVARRLEQNVEAHQKTHRLS